MPPRFRNRQMAPLSSIDHTSVQKIAFRATAEAGAPRVVENSIEASSVDVALGSR